MSLNRIDAARDPVTVMIEPEGSGLTVRESSLTFSRSSLGPKFITVQTTTDSTYTGDRRRILTLTARDYATTTVIDNYSGKYSAVDWIRGEGANRAGFGDIYEHE